MWILSIDTKEILPVDVELCKGENQQWLIELIVKLMVCESVTRIKIERVINYDA